MTTTREDKMEAALKKISAGTENPAMFARVTLGNNTKILPLTEADKSLAEQLDAMPYGHDYLIKVEADIGIPISELAAVLAVPEVRALVEAGQSMRRQFSPFPSEDTERWREEHEACAAIAALVQS